MDMEDDFIGNHVEEYELMKLREKLDDLSDDDFIDYVLEHGKKDDMNSVIPDNKFPAYDIAQNISDNKWRPSKKQRDGITNIYIYVHSKTEPNW